jgi:hypothetical protein
MQRKRGGTTDGLEDLKERNDRRSTAVLQVRTLRLLPGKNDMNGIKSGHVKIGFTDAIWPEMKSHYDRLTGKRRGIVIRYQGRTVVEVVIGKRSRSPINAFLPG